MIIVVIISRFLGRFVIIDAWFEAGKLFDLSHDLYLIGSTTLKVLIEVDAALTEGDYEFKIRKNGREINRLLIQNETLVAEYM